jgi:hypothetical protein
MSAVVPNIQFSAIEGIRSRAKASFRVRPFKLSQSLVSAFQKLSLSGHANAQASLVNGIDGC